MYLFSYFVVEPNLELTLKSMVQGAYFGESSAGDTASLISYSTALLPALSVQHSYFYADVQSLNYLARQDCCFIMTIPKLIGKKTAIIKISCQGKCTIISSKVNIMFFDPWQAEAVEAL